MGREVRRVPENWEHPKEGRYNYRLGRHEEVFKPLFDRDYDSESREWVEGCIAWSRGEHEDQEKYENAPEFKYYWEYAGNPPDSNDHVPYDRDDESLCTWWQAYETVSEGTPVSPPFATAEELIDYLSTHGDFWEQSRAEEEGRAVRPSRRETVRKFVECGHALSGAITTGPDKQVVALTGIDAVDL